MVKLELLALQQQQTLRQMLRGLAQVKTQDFLAEPLVKQSICPAEPLIF